MADFTRGFRPSTNVEDKRGELERQKLNDLFDMLFAVPQPAPLPPLVPGAEQNPLSRQAGIGDVEKSLALSVFDFPH